MKKLILLILIIFTLISCNNNTTTVDKISVDVESEKYIGIWKCVDRIIPYSAYLVIKQDSTYTYSYGACMKGGYSEGKWILQNDTITLTSNEIDSCLYLSHFGVDCVQISVDDTTVRLRETTKEGCIPDTYASEDYVKFDNESFYLDVDTLRHIIKQPKPCPYIRNDFYIPEKKIPSPNWIHGTWYNSAESNSINIEFWTFKNDSIFIQYGFPFNEKAEICLNKKFSNYYTRTQTFSNSYTVDFISNDIHVIYEFKLEEVSYEEETVLSYSITINGELKKEHSTSCNLVLTKLK